MCVCMCVLVCMSLTRVWWCVCVCACVLCTYICRLETLITAMCVCMYVHVCVSLSNVRVRITHGRCNVMLTKMRRLCVVVLLGSVHVVLDSVSKPWSHTGATQHSEHSDGGRANTRMDSTRATLCCSACVVLRRRE